jgi:hypothetical protein
MNTGSIIFSIKLHWSMTRSHNEIARGMRRSNLQRAQKKTVQFFAILYYILLCLMKRIVYLSMLISWQFPKATLAR